MHRREINEVQDTPQKAAATYFNEPQSVCL